MIRPRNLDYYQKEFQREVIEDNGSYSEEEEGGSMVDQRQDVGSQDESDQSFEEQESDNQESEGESQGEDHQEQQYQEQVAAHYRHMQAQQNNIISEELGEDEETYQQ